MHDILLKSVLMLDEEKKARSLMASDLLYIEESDRKKAISDLCGVVADNGRVHLEENKMFVPIIEGSYVVNLWCKDGSKRSFIIYLPAFTPVFFKINYTEHVITPHWFEKIITLGFIKEEVTIISEILAFQQNTSGEGCTLISRF